jgi:hypothetical protein
MPYNDKAESINNQSNTNLQEPEVKDTAQLFTVKHQKEGKPCGVHLPPCDCNPMCDCQGYDPCATNSVTP